MAHSSPSSEVDKWQDNSLAETNLYMLDNEIMCDVTFLAGEKREPVSAHKFMLVSRSPVFYAMFCGPLAESQSEIPVPDVDAGTLKMLIRFLYTARFDPTSETVMATLYAAKKYEVGKLEQHCLDFLRDHVDGENVCTILQQAISFDEAALIERCLSFVFENSMAVLQSRGFLSLDKEGLRRILESDALSEDELSIYEACVKWAKCQLTVAGEPTSDQDVRKRLGELLYLIRFPLISQEDFVANVSQTNILTDTEKVAVFHSNVLNRNTDGPFITRERCPKGDIIIKRFKHVKDRWTHANMANVISFTCSQNVKMVGVYLFTPSTTGDGLKGRLELSDDENILYSEDIKLEYSEGDTFKELTIDPPVKLRKGKRFYLSQTCDGQTTHYGFGGEEEITERGITFNFLSSPRNKCGDTGSKSGQIYGLHCC